MTRRVVLAGDSDIAGWPPELYPSVLGIAEATDRNGNHCVSGHSGATHGQILPYVQEALNDSEKEDGGMILVFCAGENDIGQGIFLESSCKSLRQLLKMVLPISQDDATTNTNQRDRHLIFLGPKLEPWLNDDEESKRAYSAMDRAFQRCFNEYDHRLKESSPSISPCMHYIDCLTMFCGDTANLPGARLGGKAQAQEDFFDVDRLHLNDNGYAIWKDVVESVIRDKCLG